MVDKKIEINQKYILIIISFILLMQLVSPYDCDIRIDEVLVSNTQVLFSLVLLNSTGGMIPDSPQVVLNSSCYDEDGNSISPPTLTNTGDGEWQGLLVVSNPGVCHFNATHIGIVCAGDNAVWSMLISDINKTTHEINTTVHDTYDFLLDDLNVTLTSILNLTDLTYSQALDLETNISDLDNDLTSLKTYLEGKWGNENANKIKDKLKDIRSDVTYLRSRYEYTTELEKKVLLLSIKEDGREILDLVYGKDKWWEGLSIWIVPFTILLLFIVLIIWLVKRRNRKV